MRACLPRSSSTTRHYAPQSSVPPLHSTRQKRTLSDMSADHTRQATTNLSIDLPPPLSAPPRPPSPVLSSPLPSAPSSVSVENESPSPQSSQPVAPPAPVRKRRAAAVAAESAIRQQLHSDSGESRKGQPVSELTHQELLCDEDESTIDSCLSMSSVLSSGSQPLISAYVTPEPRKRRSRRRRIKAEADTTVPAAADSSVSSNSTNTDEQSAMVIPTYLPPAIHLPSDDTEPTPPLRRSTRRLSKAHSVVSTTGAVSPTVLSNVRASSLPVLRSAPAIFHDSAIIASVLSSLPLPCFLHLRAVSTSFLRASYTPAAWQHQHITVADASSLTRLRSSTALLTLLPSLTVNLVSCPNVSVDVELRAVLSRLPSLRCLRLLNCTRLTQLGVNAVLYCGALTELTVQNCGSLQARDLHDLLQYKPWLGSTERLLLIPHVPKDTTDQLSLTAAQSDILAPYRSTAYCSALSSIWSTNRPCYDHTRLIRLDLTKYRNLRDESFAMFSQSHFRDTFVDLRHLNLRGCRELSDAALARIAHIHQLHSLDLSFCVLLTEQSMEWLASPRSCTSHSLTSLTLTSVTLLTDAACEHIAKLTRLSYLNMSQLPRLTDHGLMALQHGPVCVSLREVVVSWCDRLDGDWLVSIGEGWTRLEDEKRMGADFLDYIERTSGFPNPAEREAEQNEALEYDSDGDGMELAEARREAAMIGRKRAAQREKRRRRARERSVRQQPAEDEAEMWSALRYVDVRYCHNIDIGSKVIINRLRPDIELVWR